MQHVPKETQMGENSFTSAVVNFVVPDSRVGVSDGEILISWIINLVDGPPYTPWSNLSTKLTEFESDGI